MVCLLQAESEESEDADDVQASNQQRLSKALGRLEEDHHHEQRSTRCDGWDVADERLAHSLSPLF